MRKLFLMFLIFLTCVTRGFPSMILLNVMFTPAGTGLVSIVSSVIGWSVGMVIVRGKDWLTPGLKWRDNSWGWRSRAWAVTGSVLQTFSNDWKEKEYLRGDCSLVQTSKERSLN